MGETLRASAFALTEAKYAAGDFRHTVFDNVGPASIRVSPASLPFQPSRHTLLILMRGAGDLKPPNSIWNALEPMTLPGWRCQMSRIVWHHPPWIEN